ncbi:hypothetical protein BWI17_14440 [Betaproteobacteria bacterium GR16-43]|nr:hypothetical protein BWI17_14440 [Betaproteobacteria bacterium GR16-43]
MKIRHTVLVGALGFAACGLAQAQAITVYGLVFQFAENTKTSGATSPAPAAGERPSMRNAYTGVNDPSRNRISAGTSNLGFRGSEDLGGDVKLVFQLESGFSVDGSPGPGWSGRNSNVGLSSAWGTLSLGQWDTPYKTVALPVNPIRVGYQADYTPIMGNPGFGTPATTTQQTRAGTPPDAAFDRRNGNVVQYWSPTVAGFSGRIQYSADEGRTASSATAPAIQPVIWSGNLQYDVGGLSLRYAYEQHEDYFGMSQLGGGAGATLLNPSSKDQGNKLVAIWRIGSFRLAGILEELKYHNDDSTAGNVNDYKRKAYYALGEYYFGKASVWAAYGKAEDGTCSRVGGASCSTVDLGADYISAGLVYNFSKRTQVIATYYKVDNKKSGTYTVQPPVGGPIAAGADTMAFGVGIAHFF